VGGAVQAVEHGLEDRAVHGVEQVPVDEADRSGRIEHRRLAQLRPAIVTLDVELQPKPPGHLHLGHE
jgi:hypothetical protein